MVTLTCDTLILIRPRAYIESFVTDRVVKLSVRFSLDGSSLLYSNVTNCGIRHVTVPIATRISIANVRHIGLYNILCDQSRILL